jgi:hypothetical protein
MTATAAGTLHQGVTFTCSDEWKWRPSSPMYWKTVHTRYVSSQTATATLRPSTKPAP